MLIVRTLIFHARISGDRLLAHDMLSFITLTEVLARSGSADYIGAPPHILFALWKFLNYVFPEQLIGQLIGPTTWTVVPLI
jgi:hypothetical protein